MRWSCLAVLLCLLSNVALGAPLSSGRFDQGLNLAINPDGGLLTADLSLADYNAEPSCHLYLFGEPSSDRQYLLTAVGVDATKLHQGRLIGAPDGSSVSIQLNTVPAQCQAVAGSLKHGKTMQRVAATTWHGIRWVAGERAYFHQEAHESTRRKAYVVRGDALAYTKETAAFVDAEYLKPGSTTRGWVSWADLQPLQPNSFVPEKVALPPLSDPATRAERSAWRQLLQWADHNEDHYVASVGDAATEGGLSLMGRVGNTGLLRISFGYAAYQEIMGFALTNQATSEARMLTLKGFPPDTDVPYSEAFGFDSYDVKQQILHVFSKSRGMGDCGRVFEYQLRDGGLDLKQWRMRECSDEIDEGDIDTDSWPVQSGDPDQY